MYTLSSLWLSYYNSCCCCWCCSKVISIRSMDGVCRRRESGLRAGRKVFGAFYAENQNPFRQTHQKPDNWISKSTNERQISGAEGGVYFLSLSKPSLTLEFVCETLCVAQHVFHFECKQNSNTFNILLENCFPFGIQEKQ